MKLKFKYVAKNPVTGIKIISTNFKDLYHVVLTDLKCTPYQSRYELFVDDKYVCTIFTRIAQNSAGDALAIMRNDVCTLLKIIPKLKY